MDGGRLTRATFARRRIALAAGLLIAIALFVAVVAGGSSDGAGSPRLRDAAPRRGALARRLAHPNVAAREDRAITDVGRRLPFVVAAGGGKREVALTFDDGPGPYTDRVLDLLLREHVPATFFVVGQMLRYFRPQLDHELRGGFVIGDHTMNHPSLRGKPLSFQLAQIGGDAGLLASDGVVTPRLFRPPFGLFDHTTLDVLRRRHMLAVMWTVDSSDYTRPGVPAIVHNVLLKVKPGAIVMMHDAGGDRSQTVAALPEIVRRLRKRRYTLVTVPRLLLDDPPDRRQQLPLGVRQALSHGGVGNAGA
jgi:peptidoglycan/xylan/chitin deacetylase (PgdA/CDA1 family)